MSAYYNDIEPFCCAAIERRILDGALPAGIVDERDIRDVQPDELVGFNQWHLFAGIAGLSYGLRLAGVPDSFPVLTGGFPCQQVSAAGQGEGIGTEDEPTERSGLWWEMLRIVRGVQPRYVVIENVPALRTRGADAVIESLEGTGYRLFCPADFWPELEAQPEAHIPGPVVVGAWAVGAPHRRDRVWIVANREGDDIGYDGIRGAGASSLERRTVGARSGGVQTGTIGCAASNAMADACDTERRQTTEGRRDVFDRPDAGREEAASGFELCGEAVADTEYGRREGGQQENAGRDSFNGAVMFSGQARWPAVPGQPQHEWEHSRTSLPPSLLGIWNRMRARYPQALRTAEQKRQAEKDFGLALGALDADADGLSGVVAGLKDFRNGALTAIGNAVVPQVVAVIGRALRRHWDANQ